MEPISHTIIPAQPGFKAVYENDESKTLEVSEPIIAWRIETYKKDDSNELNSFSYPITALIQSQLMVM